MIYLGLILFLFPFILRIFQLIRFIKNISIICHMYDWKCVDEDPEKCLEEVLKKEYYLKSEWSAYNFMFLKGPSPLFMYFSFKPLGLEYFYSEEIIDKIKSKILK